jgi:hypothetical protein
MIDESHLRSLDFAQLPRVESMDIFKRLDVEIESKLQKLGFFHELKERANSALMFFFQVDAKDEGWRNDARLRAGLNEFYSIEAASVRDLRTTGRRHQTPLIRESTNPLVHLLYILRHAGVHTAPPKSGIKAVDVISDFGGVRHEYSYDAAVLQPLTLADLSKVHEVNEYYKQCDLVALIDWTLREQEVFGISEIFRLGLSAYIEEILATVEAHGSN